MDPVNAAATQDELQQAINDITNTAPAATPAANDIASQVASQATATATADSVAVDPLAPMAADPLAAVDPVSAPAPVEATTADAAVAPIAPDAAIGAPVDIPPAPTVTPDPLAQAAPAAPAAPVEAMPTFDVPTMPAEPVMSAAVEVDESGEPLEITPDKSMYGNPDLDRVKSMALSDLKPVIEKAQISPEKKFMIYKDIIEITDDKACIEPAYNAAKQIADDTVRAESLVFVVESIDRLGVPLSRDDL